MIVVQISCCYMELFTYNYFVGPWSCLVAFYINDTPIIFVCSSNNGKDSDLRFYRNDFIARVKYVFTKEHEKGKFFYIGTFITPSILVLFLASCSQESLSVQVLSIEADQVEFTYGGIVVLPVL